MVGLRPTPPPRPSPRRGAPVSPESPESPEHAAVGLIGPIGHIGRRLPPLCRTVCLSPRRGAPASPASPESPDSDCGRVSAPSPKRGVRSPPRPTGPRAGRAPFVEVWKFRGLEVWSLHRGLIRRALAARSVLRFPFSVLRGARGAPCLFVVLRVLCDSRAACAPPISQSANQPISQGDLRSRPW